MGILLHPLDLRYPRSIAAKVDSRSYGDGAVVLELPGQGAHDVLAADAINQVIFPDDSLL